MMISVSPPALPMADPLAVEPVKLIVPKSVSGKMPPPDVQHGASTMTSAEDRDGVCPRLAPVVWLQPCVARFSPSQPGSVQANSAQLPLSPLVNSGGALPGPICAFSAASSLSTSASVPA